MSRADESREKVVDALHKAEDRYIEREPMNRGDRWRESTEETLFQMLRASFGGFELALRDSRYGKAKYELLDIMAGAAICYAKLEAIGVTDAH